MIWLTKRTSSSYVTCSLYDIADKSDLIIICNLFSLCQLYHGENKLHMMMRSALSAISWREQVTYDDEVRFVSYIIERTSYIWWWGSLCQLYHGENKLHMMMRSALSAISWREQVTTKRPSSSYVTCSLYDIADKADLIIICNLFSPWYSWQRGPHHHNDEVRFVSYIMERTSYIWWWGPLCQLYHRENKLHMMMRSALSAIS
jgi:hypothetical protein